MKASYILSPDELMKYTEAVVYLTENDRKFLVHYGYENAVEIYNNLKNKPAKKRVKCNHCGKKFKEVHLCKKTNHHGDLVTRQDVFKSMGYENYRTM